MIQVTITNTQSQATPSPFQVRLVLNLSSIISSASQLLNLGFYLSSNLTNQIYAWIESYNSDFSQVVVWVNLPDGIPASSSVIVYICLQSSSQYPYTGIAPQLTSTYGEYDNGENVFLFYDNFAGTSLNTNKWKALASYYSVDNGLTIEQPTNTSSRVIDIVSVQSFDIPFIIDVYALCADPSSNNAIIFGYNGSTAYGLYTYSYNLWTCSTDECGVNELQSNSWDKGGNEIVTIKVTSSELTFEYNYQLVNTYSGSISGNGNIGFSDNGTSTYYWIRVRAYPPNGVDPTVTVSSSSTTTTSSSSNVQNEAFYIQQAISKAQAQNEAFYIQQAISKAQAQNEAFYIQPYTVSPPKVQNEAFYIQPYTVSPPKVQNEAFFVTHVAVSLPVQNEAFFIQQVQIKITHITVPEYIHFISIPQGYYNDISLNIGVSTELKLVKPYIFGISYNVTMSTQIKTTTIPTPQNVELDAIEVGIFIPALYFLGKKLYNKLIRRRKK